ncbi:MAG: sigma-70 family RNA polymerase sigma factor [Myxococcota bacterium]
MDDRDEIGILARAGDLAALDRLTRTRSDRLLAVGRRWCRTDEEARDAVQDALLAATTHLDQYRGEGEVEGWVARIVARACARLRRGRKNDPALHRVLVDAELVSELADPETLAGRARIAVALGEALAELGPLDRAVLLLAEAEDRTGPEIAEALGTTPSAVRTRLTRARQRMREALASRLALDG